MTPKLALPVVLAAMLAFAAPKERDWQDGKLVNTHANRYFTTADLPQEEGPGLVTAGGARSSPSEELGTHPLENQSNLMVDYYIIEAPSVAYLSEVQRMRSFPAAKVAINQPVKFAVEKNKLWIIGEDGKEFETKILKQVPRSGGVLLTEVKPAAAPEPQPKPEPKPQVRPEPKPEPKIAAAKPAPQPKPAPEPKPARAAKPEPTTTAKLEQPSMAKSIVQPGSAVKKEAASALPVQAATPKEEARETFVGVRLTPKPEPPPAIIKPVAPAEPAAKPALKDRPWQAGKLLSVAANTYFDGVPFTTDMDGGSWGFAQGKGGKMNVSVRAVSLPTNPFTFDSYMIETDFCVYLVQRERQKNTTMARFNGTAPLRFAVEKNKLWVIDEDGKEVETKVIKQLQKEQPSPATGLAQTASR